MPTKTHQHMCAQSLRMVGTSCTDGMLRRWLPRSAPAIIVTYATEVPPAWLLGLSAALHNVPLVLVGFKNEYKGDNKQKAFGTMRAAAVLQRLWPHTVLLVADAWDTVVINAPKRASKHLGYIANRTVAMLSTECNSWPRCYHAAFARDRTLARCLATPGYTCYINGGMYAATATTIGALLPAMDAQNLRHWNYAERSSDQARMTRLRLSQEDPQLAEGRALSSLQSSAFTDLNEAMSQLHQQPVRVASSYSPHTRGSSAAHLPSQLKLPSKASKSDNNALRSRSAHHGLARGGRGTRARSVSRDFGATVSVDKPSRLLLRVDMESSLFLNLYACHGRNYTRVTGLGHEYCHHREHEPLAGMRVHASGHGVSYSGMEGRPAHHPILLHANGAGAQAAKLASPKLLPVMRLLKPSSTALRRHRVLLVDPTEQRASCHVTTLGTLLVDAADACNASKRCALKAAATAQP